LDGTFVPELENCLAKYLLENAATSHSFSNIELEKLLVDDLDDHDDLDDLDDLDELDDLDDLDDLYLDLARMIYLPISKLRDSGRPSV